MHGWMDGCMDGCMDGWMEGWMDGECIYIYTHLFTYYVLTNMPSLLCLYRGNIPNLMVSKARHLVILVRGEAPYKLVYKPGVLKGFDRDICI